ncbi:MAG: 7-cyano-7-deazaguanine synthase [Pyrinomonadaceae bacterium]
MRRRLAVSIEHLARIGGSSLTDAAIPVAEADLASPTIPTSYVPFRNAHLLSIAVSWAEVIKASSIYIGAVAEDSSGYPDCRPEFYAAFQGAINVGTRPETRVEIRTPVIHLSKAEIVKRGIELKAPLELTWSCYQEESVPWRTLRFVHSALTRISRSKYFRSDLSCVNACGCCTICALQFNELLSGCSHQTQRVGRTHRACFAS